MCGGAGSAWRRHAHLIAAVGRAGAAGLRQRSGAAVAGVRSVWDARQQPQMWQLTEKEDPYSYYRGKAESFANMTPKERVGRLLWVGTPVGAFLGTLLYYYLEDQKKWKAQEAEKLAEGDEHTVTNWSGTHEVTTKRFYQPTSLYELEQYVAKAHRNKTRLRVVGAGLSPNGIGLDEDGMVSLALMDRVLSVDARRKQVTVEAGARVSQVLDALRPYGLTLQNLASISEQQIGGFMSVSAHGSGATLPPVDEQVVSYKLVTPALGTLTLSKKGVSVAKTAGADGDFIAADKFAGSKPGYGFKMGDKGLGYYKDSPMPLPAAAAVAEADVNADDGNFEWGRVGLGALGVVAEVTLQCVPAHQLHERTWVSTMAQVEQDHVELVTKNRHVRYMWIPHTDSVVVVVSNPLKAWYDPSRWLGALTAPRTRAPLPLEEKLAPMRELLQGHGQEPEAGMSLPQLRDALLKVDPVNPEHVKRVNRAEAACWQRMQGERVEWSDKVLGFECGGQQWVSEVCFPAGTAGTPDLRDIHYTKELLDMIAAENVAAPSPIEQRWTAASASPMSPAHSAAGTDLFSWLGIIMYLPPDDVSQRADITEAFLAYKELCRQRLWQKYRAKQHWAKIEVPLDKDEALAQKTQLHRLYPAEEFNRLRQLFDPNNVLSNKLVNALF